MLHPKNFSQTEPGVITIMYSDSMNCLRTSFRTGVHNLPPWFGLPFLSSSQSIGQTKRLNQETIRFLHSYCYRNPADWSRYLMWGEYAPNSLIKPSTGLTQFKCLLGLLQPPFFSWSVDHTNLPSVNDWLQRTPKIRLTTTSNEPSEDRRFRQIPSITQGSEFVSNNPAENSLPGMWAYSKFKDKLPLFYIV